MALIFGVTIMLAILVPNIVAPEISSKDTELIQKLIACKNESGASDMDMEKLANGVEPATKEGKCLEACYLNYLEVNLINLVNDGTLIGSNGRTLAKAINEIADECKTVSDASECESAAQLLTCLNTAARKRGFCASVF